MPCYFPLQARFSLREDGKKSLFFSSSDSRLWYEHGAKPLGDNCLTLPCGRCMGCRLERSRQWALRMVHEASLHESSCFVTLTYDPESLSRECPRGSLVKKHVQDFMKRLRRRFEDRKISSFYCGEYGDDLNRPHFHICLFNLDFDDKVKFFKSNGFWHYTSSVLSSLWKFGHCSLTGFSFETAAYVARYCTKKVTGSDADDHYRRVDSTTGLVYHLTPEFAQASLRPAIGRMWIDKFGSSSVFPHDNCVVRGALCKPPRYYDKRLEATDPVAFEKLKVRRRQAGEAQQEDVTKDRLAVRLKCQEARFKKLFRRLDSNC